MHGTLNEPYRLDWETSFNRLEYDCSKCLMGCCRLYEIRLTSNDFKRIADKHRNPKKIVGLKDEKTVMKRSPDGTCIMLEKNLCTIHEIKPRVCRTFPLFINPASNGSMKIDCMRLCPESNKEFEVDEKEVEECIKLMVKEYGDYYSRQSKYYKNLSNKLKEKYPLLENLSKVETQVENTLREVMEDEFNPNEIYQQIRKMDNKDYEKPMEESSLLNCVKEILECGVNAIEYTSKGVEECEIKLVGNALIAMNKALGIEEVKVPKLNAKEREKTLEYLIEISKRGNASQYMIKSLRDGRKKDVFDAMANYLHYHACALAVYLNFYKKLNEAIASKEYSFNRRIDKMLS